MDSTADTYGNAHGFDFAAIGRAIEQAGIWIDPVNRERAAYISGRIDVDEFERRVGKLLGLTAA